MKKFFCLLLIFVIGLFVSGCGYKPSVHYIKETVKGDVFVSLKMDNEDPKNSVIVKDALISIVEDRFHRNVVQDRLVADTILDVSIDDVLFTSISTDKDGYVNLYRANVKLTLNYTSGDVTKKLTRSAYEEFGVNDGSLIVENRRFEVIKSVASKALEDMIALISVQGINE